MKHQGLSVGYGRDIHRLFPGRPLVLGGVIVDAESGFETHGDGDVLCHALIDALAGAMADGDLGTHYPEDDPDTAEVRSLDLVVPFAEYVRKRGYEIISIDSFIVLGTTRLLPYVKEMRGNLARALGVDETQVSVKARSNDGIAPEGTGVAASANVVVLLSRYPSGER